MRTIMTPVERFRGPAACLAAGLLLSACSADVTRFDFPAFSLGQTGDETAALPSPPEPIYQFNAPTKQSDQLPAYGRAKPYQVAQADTGVARSNLGRPADSIDALQPETRPRPVRVRRYQPESASSDRGGVGRATVVQRGDTLYGISRRTGVSVSRIMEANDLGTSSIRVGQRLMIPGSSLRSNEDRYEDPVTTASAGDRIEVEPRPVRRATPSRFGDGEKYRVRAGDSLYGIARKTGASAKAIASANGITDPSRLSIGQVLMIPGSASDNDGYGERKTASKPLLPRATKRRTATRKVVSLDRTAGVSDDILDAPRKLTPSTAFRWPVRGRVVSKFGGKVKTGNNDGINLAVPAGTSVKAAEDGVVAYAGSELKGYGRLLLVRHADDWVSAYAHNSQLLAKRGDKVRRGQIIAKAGRSGDVDRPQVHFELRKGSKPVDPMKYLARN